jgi:lipopolysaccharide export system permease protein
MKEFARLFTLICMGLALILTLLNLIKRIEDLISYKPSALDILYYASLSFPLYFLHLMPVSALMCSLYTVGHATRTKEMMAVMAAGGRLKRLLMPFVIAGVVLSMLGFVLGEFVVPACSKQARELKNSITHKTKVPSILLDGKLWLRTRNGSVVKADLFIEEEDSFRGINVFRISDGELKEIIRADEARFEGRDNTWVLRDVKRYDAETGEVMTVRDMRFPLLNSPEVFREEVQKPHEMGFMELKRYLGRLEEAGFRNTRLKVEMNSKLSYPLVSFFMVVLGISFAAKRSMGGLVATAVGLLVSLLYWLGYTMALSFGYAGILHPLLAAWAVPFFFGVVSAWLFRKIPE